MMNTTPDTTTVPWREIKSRRRFSDTRTARAARPTRVQLTGRDLVVLDFVAAHRFVTAAQVHQFVGGDRSVAYRLLGRLVDVGLLRYERIFHAQPGVFLVTHGGLAVIESRLARPTIDLRLYRHEVLVPNLYLAARAGSFGPVSELHTERQLKHRDQLPDVGSPLGSRLSGFDRAGRPKLHHPDVLVVHPDGSRTGIELELSLKSRRRIEDIVLAYFLDDHYRRAVYLVDQPAVMASLVATVGTYGAEAKVEVLRPANFQVAKIQSVVASRGGGSNAV